MSVKVFDESGNVTAEALDAIFHRWPAEPPRGVLRDAYSQAQHALVLDPALAHVRAMPSIGPAIAEACAKMLRENPPPPDAMLPEGCTRWVPRFEPELDYREEGVFAWFKWEAKR